MEWLAAHLNFTPEQETVLFVNFVTLCGIVANYVQSRANGSKLTTAHKELAVNTAATIEIAKATNGKLDAALESANADRQTIAQAARAAIAGALSKGT